MQFKGTLVNPNCQLLPGRNYAGAAWTLVIALTIHSHIYYSQEAGLVIYVRIKISWMSAQGQMSPSILIDWERLQYLPSTYCITFYVRVHSKGTQICD